MLILAVIAMVYLAGFVVVGNIQYKDLMGQKYTVSSGDLFEALLICIFWPVILATYLLNESCSWVSCKILDHFNKGK